ncbi:MAG TPA: TonB-dependent receptor, partial [bacterium]|nr:TonB-dependent receptor [bacterium]
MLKRFIITVFFTYCIVLYPQETVQKDTGKTSVTGIVLERGTKAPVAKKNFYIIETDEKIRTDKDGRFSFDIAPGTYTLSFPIVGFEKFETKIEVKKGEKLDLTFRLEPLVINPYKIVVTGEKNKGEVSVQRVTIEEASKIPGTNRDVLKAVTSLPGVTNISVFNGYGSGLVIRGSSAGDSSTVVDEHGIPLMYHFGGLDPVIEPELVESLDFFAGGFSSEYFNTMGGVIQLNLRDPRKDRWGGYLNLSLLNISFMAEGPVSDKDYLAVAFKRGMLDAYVKIAEELGLFNNMLSFSTYPFYYDAMVLYVHEFSKRNKLKMYTIGTWDEVKARFDNQTAIQKMSNTAQTKTQYIQHTTEWHYRDNDFKSLFSPMAEVVWVDINAGDTAYFKNFFFQLELSEKMELKLNDNHKLRFGAKFYYGYYTMDVNLFAMPKEGEVAYNPLSNEIEDHSEGHYWFPGAFFMDEITYGGWTVVPGINFIYDEHNTQMLFDPRLSIKYRINDQWTLKTAGGIYSQLPSN